MKNPHRFISSINVIFVSMADTLEQPEENNSAIKSESELITKASEELQIEQNKEAENVSKDEDIVEKKDGIFTDIFGDSDEDVYDETNVDKNKEGDQETAKKTTEISGMSDFDIMMANKKAANRKHRRSKNYDYINQNDDLAGDIVSKMFQAAKNDRAKVEVGEFGISKLNLLSFIRTELQRIDMYETYVDHNIHSALADWLNPLPDGSLPNIRIRTTLLNILEEWPCPSSSLLKSSGIGKAVMLLSKHPKEVSANRKLATKIISEWARPIFGISANLSELSREDREQQDMKHYKSMIKRRLAEGEEEKEPESKLKPGDKGFINRARIPKSSNVEYIVRPKKLIPSASDDHLNIMVKERIRKNQQAKKLNKIFRINKSKI